jgi:predicted  nucleic acid-binding Zn-ribbon protein
MDDVSTDRVLQALSTLAALLDGTIKEVKALDLEFRRRLKQAVEETEVTVQTEAAQLLQTTVTETRKKIEDQFSNRVVELSAQWNEERERLNTQLMKMTQSAAQWEAERARLNGEIDRLNSALDASRAEARTAGKDSTASAANSDAVHAEIRRIEGLIRDISALIEDPTSELSIVIRKNVERSELESYLKGMLFALNGPGA